MVHFEDRFEPKGESPEQRLVSSDFPIIANENAGAVLNEVPNAPPAKVSLSLQGKPMRVPRLSDPAGSSPGSRAASPG